MGTRETKGNLVCVFTIHYVHLYVYLSANGVTTTVIY